jgi:hypothetical protein
MQSREAKLKNQEDVSRYGSLLLQHYKHKLADDECESQPALARRKTCQSMHTTELTVAVNCLQLADAATAAAHPAC